MNESKTIAIIPAYNEEENIGKVLKKMQKHIKNGIIDKLLVIDDCSTDRTAEIAKAMGAEVISHIINQGIGGAQRTGYKIAIENSYDYIIQLDADDQHNPKYIPKMLKMIKDSDIVIGSRFLNNSCKKYSFVRKMGIKFFSGTVKKLTSMNLTDVTSGFRVYRMNKLKELSELPNKHWAVEQTLEAGKKGFKVAEISTHMPVRENGKSQFDLKTYVYYPLRMVSAILRVLLFR